MGGDIGSIPRLSACALFSLRQKSNFDPEAMSPMPRLPFPDTSSPDLAPIRDRIVSARGSLLDLYRLLLHSPPLASGWLELLTSVRNEISLPPDLRELIIVRIAFLNDAPYEARQHIPIALECGASQDQIEALHAWEQNTALFDDVAQAALAYTDSMTRNVKVPEPIWKSLRDRFSERECLEITVLVAAYNMVSRVLSALELE